jgi:hypothetical protein
VTTVTGLKVRAIVALATLAHLALVVGEFGFHKGP